MEQEKLSCLSEKQRVVYELRQQGETYAAISARLGITLNAVRERQLHAERRIRECLQYKNMQKRNEEPVSIVFTRGELRLIELALKTLIDNQERKVVHRIRSDWEGRQSYLHDTAVALKERVRQARYKK